MPDRYSVEGILTGGEDTFRAGRDYMDMQQICDRLPVLQKEIKKTASRGYALMAVVIVLCLLGFVLNLLGIRWYIAYLPILGCVAVYITGMRFAARGRRLREEAETLRDRAQDLAQYYR